MLAKVVPGKPGHRAAGKGSGAVRCPNGCWDGARARAGGWRSLQCQGNFNLKQQLK